MAQMSYFPCPASTNQQLGDAPGSGDQLDFILCVPASLSPGAVTIQDGASAPITVFVGGAGSVASLIPFSIPISAKANGAGWKVNCGAAISAFAVGEFN